MKARMNETQLWYCNICDKTVHTKSRSKHNNSKTHEHKEKYGTVVEKNYLINPEIDEVTSTFNDNKKNCKKNVFTLLKVDVYMISILQLWKITKKVF